MKKMSASGKKSASSKDWIPKVVGKNKIKCIDNRPKPKGKTIKL